MIFMIIFAIALLYTTVRILINLSYTPNLTLAINQRKAEIAMYS